MGFDDKTTVATEEIREDVDGTTAWLEDAAAFGEPRSIGAHEAIGSVDDDLDSFKRPAEVPADFQDEGRGDELVEALRQRKGGGNGAAALNAGLFPNEGKDRRQNRRGERRRRLIRWDHRRIAGRDQ